MSLDILFSFYYRYLVISKGFFFWCVFVWQKSCLIEHENLLIQAKICLSMVTLEIFDGF
jgi:hypothetical protein